MVHIYFQLSLKEKVVLEVMTEIYSTYVEITTLCICHTNNTEALFAPLIITDEFIPEKRPLFEAFL